MSRVFEARYGGVCAACGYRIQPGETVVFDRADELLHDTCTEPGPVGGKLCPRCHLVMPLSGICENH